jgi:hypothetical protein
MGVAEAVVGDGSDARTAELNAPELPEYQSSLGEQILSGQIAKFPTGMPERFDQYDGQGEEPFNVMIHVHIYRLITERSFHELELHLKSAWKIRENLRVETVLDHTTYAKSWRDQFSDGIRNDIRMMAENIKEYLERFDSPELEPYLDTEPETENSSGELSDAQKRRCVNNVWGMIESQFDFDRGPGIEWSTSYLYDVFGEGASKGITPYEVLDKERKESDDAAHKTVMNAVDQRSPQEWVDLFDTLFQTIFDRLHDAGWFTREVDAYVDGTKRPMWPTGELPEGVKGGDVKESTNYAWQFATLVVEERGIQVPVAVVPITDDVAHEDQLEKLLDQARGRVNIDVLQADGAYAGARSQRVLKESSLVNDYIVRGSRRGNEIKRRLVTMTGKFDDAGRYTTVSADKQVRAESRLVADPDWDNATEEYLNTVPDSVQHGLGAFGAGSVNGAVDLDDVDKKLWQSRRPYLTSLTPEQASAKEVTELYDDRWIVEDNYANTKRNQLGKTDSPNHSIQTFVFCLGMLFSAVWTACRVFLREDHPDCIPDDRPIISAREIVVFVRLEYG